MRKQSSRTSRFSIVALGCVVLSSILFFLPATWTRPLRSLVQVLLPFQHAASTVSDAVTEAVTDKGEASDENDQTLFQEPLPLPLPLAERGENGTGSMGVQSEREACEHRTAALSLRVQELEDEVRLLTATRLWEIDGASMRTSGRLIPARAVAGDILPWRDSLLLNSGRLQGVSQGAIVATDRFVVDRGEAVGVREGMAVLLGETLIGWVDELHAHASRVKCVSDRSVEMKVRIGRVTETGFESVQEYFWLAGRGRGRMEIREVDRRLIEERAVEVGDLVVSDPASPLLAIPMAVGRVSEIGPNRENPLFSVVTVQTGLERAPLRRVYVFDPRGDDDHGR